ncbi:MAG TPA: AI-2E family transporter YdiK [Rubrivivax sp.]|nr:AI-2E family transporter YdiK [Rubrivivax sp.]
MSPRQGGTGTNGGLPPRDLARNTLAVLFLGLLIGTSLWVLRPFLGPAVWAAMVVIATWPLMLGIQQRLWGRRWLAVTVMLLALVLLFVAPLSAAIATVVGNADRIVGWAKAASAFRLGAPPAWLLSLPVVGSVLATAWQELAAAGVDDVLEQLQPYAGEVTNWFVAEAGSIGRLMMQFLFTLLLAGVMYGCGERAADIVTRFGRRLGGLHGQQVVELAGAAIRGVAIGVGVTAVLQTALGWFGLWMAGVPFAGVLTALMFMLCIAQIGALPVLLPAAIWLFWGGATGWGIFLVIWALFVGTIDNVVRPLLIRVGADLPLLLIFVGVIGGLFAFGIVGIFVGPVVLAVAWTLLQAWLDEGHEPLA